LYVTCSIRLAFLILIIDLEFCNTESAFGNQTSIVHSTRYVYRMYRYKARISSTKINEWMAAFSRKSSLVSTLRDWLLLLEPTNHVQLLTRQCATWLVITFRANQSLSSVVDHSWLSRSRFGIAHWLMLTSTQCYGKHPGVILYEIYGSLHIVLHTLHRGKIRILLEM